MSARGFADSMMRWSMVCALGVSMGATGGCGKTSRVLESGDDRDGGVGGDAAGSGGGGAGVGADGGPAGGGSVGDGGSTGGGGTGGTQGTGGISGAGGTFPGIGGTASQLDPYAEERRQIAADYCALLETYPCLWFRRFERFDPVTMREEMIESCRRELEVNQGNWGDACFDEWQAHMQCLTTAPWSCPCSELDCDLPSPSNSSSTLGGLCDAPYDALRACHGTEAGQSVVVTGDAGECTYSWREQGCYVQCSRDVDIFESDCYGAVGGAQACSCVLNGVHLRDPSNESGYFWADDCPGVAQIMADGYCDRILDCCFTWVKDGVPQCTCTADPTAGGFATCDAAAAAGGGEVVDLCPQYQLVWGEFPQP